MIWWQTAQAAAWSLAGWAAVSGRAAAWGDFSSRAGDAWGDAMGMLGLPWLRRLPCAAIPLAACAVAEFVTGSFFAGTAAGIVGVAAGMRAGAFLLPWDPVPIVPSGPWSEEVGAAAHRVALDCRHGTDGKSAGSSAKSL